MQCIKNFSTFALLKHEVMLNKKGRIHNVGWYISGTVGIMLLFLLFWGSDYEPASQIIGKSTQLTTIPLIPDTVEFCGETLPLEFFDVKESLEREILVNSYWHSQTIWLLQKSNRFFPVIEPILKEYGIPDDFKYLAVAESGLSHIVSPASAAGFWQLLEGTAKDYNLEVNSEVDERYHLEKATIAACKYIQQSHKKYGNWTLTAASYNAGRRGIDRQITKQKENNYYDLLLNDETARYVYRIIALKLVFENPQNYNFNIPAESLYKPIPFKTIEVNTRIESWADFAHEHNTNYKMLKTFNPWLRDSQLTNKNNKTYSIKIPKKKARLVKD